LKEYLTIKQIAQLCPGNPKASTVWRWCRKGVETANGTRIRLQHVRVGRWLFIAEQWLDDFLSAVAAADTSYFIEGEA